MKNNVAQIISYLFHPLFIALYGFALILFTDNYFSYFFSFNIKLLLLAITFSFTCMLPAFNIYILKRFGLISSVYLNDGRERTFPYLLTSMFYLGMIYLIKDFQIPGVFTAVLFSAAIAIIITALVNLKWKISAHMIGMGGLAGIILALSFVLGANLLVWFCLTILAAGLTGFARIKLAAHTSLQVYLGFVTGLFISFIFIILVNTINLHALF